MMKKIYGILGDPIAHSLSPVMHNAAFEELGMDAIYLAFRVPKPDLEAAIKGAKSLGITGLNVTIPLKEEALFFVDADEVAKSIGAINTIDFSSGTPVGYNTDGIAVSGVTGSNWTIMIDSVDFGDVVNWYAASGESSDYSDDLTLTLGHEYRIVVEGHTPSGAPVKPIIP